MESLVIYLIFNYYVASILGTWGSVFGVDYALEAGADSGLANIANIKTLDMGMMGALLISGLAIFLHNKYF
ncbi:MAG: alpha-glucoside-specific phosphotransferase enzyme IIB component, partial [Anaerococcus hydrogenalis]|nr:alpha-glucoside-specific phosphotransferase enzyme IIB component [Anaerococcus hydrogenalis]